MRLLLVIEASNLGHVIVRYGIQLARRLHGSVVLHFPSAPLPLEGGSAQLAEIEAERSLEGVRAEAGEWFDAARTLAAEGGIQAKEIVTVDEEPLAAVLRLVAEESCDMVVAGSHGRGAIGRLLLGSLVADLAKRSPVPIVAVREGMRAELPPAAAQ